MRVRYAQDEIVRWSRCDAVGCVPRRTRSAYAAHDRYTIGCSSSGHAPLCSEGVPQSLFAVCCAWLGGQAPLSQESATGTVAERVTVRREVAFRHGVLWSAVACYRSCPGQLAAGASTREQARFDKAQASLRTPHCPRTRRKVGGPSRLSGGTSPGAVALGGGGIQRGASRMMEPLVTGTFGADLAWLIGGSKRRSGEGNRL